MVLNLQTRFEALSEQLGLGQSDDEKKHSLTFDDLFADSSGEFPGKVKIFLLKLHRK